MIGKENTAAREYKPKLLLTVGGGSCIFMSVKGIVDSAKPMLRLAEQSRPGLQPVINIA